MTFRGLAVFSLATVFSSLEACRPEATVRPPAAPPLTIPAYVPTQSVPTLPPANPVIPVEPPTSPEPTVPETFQAWRPTSEQRDWTSIVIHHTATDKGSVESIHQAHLDREWLGIGYHFVIGNGNGMPDGEVEPTFRWRQQLHGAHAGSKEFNDYGIGIALIGNFELSDPTDAQLTAIKKLVRFLAEKYEIPAERIIGHQEIKATVCPGQRFPMADLRAVVGQNTPSEKTSFLHQPSPHASFGARAELVGSIPQ